MEFCLKASILTQFSERCVAFIKNRKTVQLHSEQQHLLVIEHLSAFSNKSKLKLDVQNTDYRQHNDENYLNYHLWENSITYLEAPKIKRWKGQDHDQLFFQDSIWSNMAKYNA